MSIFSFNKMFIIQSLQSDEMQTGTLLEKHLNEWAQAQKTNFQVITYEVHSMQEWDIAWNGIYTGIRDMGNIPIIHLEMHGNQSSLGIDGGTKGTISMDEVFEKVQQANVLSQNNVFLSLAVCMGLNVIRSLRVYQPMPFCGILGSEHPLPNQELLNNYIIFYENFLLTLNLDKAQQALQQAGIDASKYKLLKPEEIFMNAFLGYLETYKTDAGIEEKAIKAAQQEGIIFADDEEKKRFIQHYRCQLLTTENTEYIKALRSFFMFDRYPEIETRFEVPKDIYEFKEYAGHQGHEWLLQRRKMTDEEIKIVSLDILQQVHDFCMKNDIKYSLAYGTLLGAVRHKGFIPWDDDIDILMLRPDYERFVKLFNKLSDSTYSVTSYETDAQFRYAFAKIVNNSTIKDELGFDKYGIGIDLFPIDKVPNNPNLAYKLFKLHKLYWNLFMLKAMKWDNNRSLSKNLFLIASKVILFFIPYSVIHKMAYKSVAKYSDLKDDYMLGCLSSPYGMKDMMPKEIFDSPILLPFEQNQYCCLKEYDRYLSSLYGDYMQLPPEEKRVTHHAFKTFWK